MHRVAALLLLLTAVACSGNGGSAGGDTARSDTASGEYLIALAPGSGPGEVLALYAEYGVTVVEELGRGRLLIRLRPDPGPAVVSRIAEGSAAVRYAQPNYRYQATPEE